ncbi:MAG: glycoside hydrolase family 2 [Ruminococcaceae bacterium]|nr:glycoside hydrolase family 2 [Oscillospiraceae bacterium]
MYTVHGENLSKTPWDCYPRPQMRRNSYVNLNGIWDFTVSHAEAFPESYDRKILVPFCPESPLSGLETHYPEGAYLFYRRTFSRPQTDGRILLHIGAADQELSCYVNSKKVGSHSGGYEAITFDITAYLQEENTLLLRCRDDLRRKEYPYGKQVMKRGGMWYTPVSGIWQTVWLESVPETYIQKLEITNRGDRVTICVSPPQEGMVTVADLGSYPLTDGRVEISPESPHFWSPEDPYLYEFSVQTSTDRVESYFALRTLEVQTVDGIPRLCLNSKPYFFHGVLDQGYWPDGLFTPPHPQAYADDILAMKKLGFNTLRKHIKVEAEEFYYQCDKLGMVVFQDMVNNGSYSFLQDTALPTLGKQKRKDHRRNRDPKVRQGFLDAMTATVNQLKNHPCILYWTIFNEGWGQFDSDRVYPQLKALDDTRFIDTTSGWFRRKETDVESLHIYFDRWGRLKPAQKPLVLSEFGGHTYAVEDHLWNPGKAYGYKTCKTPEAYRRSIETLYRSVIIPAVKKGLCAAIYTQLSDVEDEINGFFTYDRKVNKADPETMQAIARALFEAL